MDTELIDIENLDPDTELSLEEEELYLAQHGLSASDVKNQMQRRFVLAYLRYQGEFGAGKKAAIRAGYSPSTAASIASEMLKKPHIRTAIQAEMDRRAARLSIAPDRVLAEFAKIAFCDMTEIVRVEDGKVVVTDTRDLRQEDTAAIASICETPVKGGGKKIEIKMHSKQAALEALGRHLVLFKDKVEVDYTKVGGVLRVPGRMDVGTWEASVAQPIEFAVPMPITEEEEVPEP